MNCGDRGRDEDDEWDENDKLDEDNERDEDDKRDEDEKEEMSVADLTGPVDIPELTNPTEPVDLPELTDIAIVGGGPAGLSAAVNAAARGKRALVFSAGPSPLAKAERVNNYLGEPGLSGQAMMERFIAHALQMGVVIAKGRITGILPMGKQYLLSCGSRVVTAGAVILATGVVRAGGVSGEADFLGKGVSYCATCDGMLYRGKRALVYGLASDAAAEANYLAALGVDVTFLRPGNRPAELSSDIPFYAGTLRAVKGGRTVKSAAIQLIPAPQSPFEPSAGAAPPASVSPPAEPPPKAEGDWEITVEGIFLLREALAPQVLISGVALKDGHIAGDSRMNAGLPGLFACGDCLGGALQVAKAVGEGLAAGQEAAKYLDSLGKDKEN
ncbi:MAG: NAD(P)/FAD-dependent oxidoreductase [Peptococcaceae bacterium]|jgi:thioredoxin reductase (NADPH)|nr:NAD(P)/FAD-dependent oxidoreductase [Peptococcaceae bacterium]